MTASQIDPSIQKTAEVLQYGMFINFLTALCAVNTKKNNPAFIQNLLSLLMKNYASLAPAEQEEVKFVTQETSKNQAEQFIAELATQMPIEEAKKVVAELHEVFMTRFQTKNKGGNNG